MAKQRKTARSVRGRKTKGRKAATLVRDMILQVFPGLTANDVYKPVGTMPGCDLHLSQAARSLFGYGVEVKCQESIAIWDALRQCVDNAAAAGLKPALFFKRNRTPMYVALPAEDFLYLVAQCAAAGPHAEPRGQLPSNVFLD